MKPSKDQIGDINLTKIRPSLQEGVISSFWTMLRELETQADNKSDNTLKHQCAGWYKQWNRMTGDNKEPIWVVRQKKAEENGWY